MLRNQRGQAAIEYLMNYAWAIALIIIVGVAIFGLNIGGIRNSLTSQSSQITQAGEQLAVTGHKCSPQTFNFSLQNNGANKLTLSTQTVQTISGSTGSGTCTPVSTTLFPGESTTCTVSAVTCSTIGNPYKVGMILDYTDTQTNLQYKPVRNITGAAQAA